MTDNKLELIRQYCDTTGVRLHEWEKDLLCKVLSSPAYYNGFESRVFEEKNSGRDYRDTWSNHKKWQYKLSFENGRLWVYERFYLTVSDGRDDDRWYWDNGWQTCEIREILRRLEEMEGDL